MPLAFPTFTLAGATTLLALLAACAGALDDTQAQPVASDWPPVWQDARPRPVAGPPAFEPPTARSCRQSPTTREVAGDAGPRHRPEAALAAASRLAKAPRDADEASASRAEERTARGAAGVAADASRPAPPAAVAPSPWAQPEMRRRERPAHEPVTAGVVDDNADFGEYLAYRARHAGLPVNDRDVSERYLVEVVDAAGRPVHDAEVAVQRAGVAAPVAWARTDTAGRVWLHPRVFLDEGAFIPAGPPRGERVLGVAVRQGAWQAQGTLVRGDRQALQLRLGGAGAPQRPRLDLVFMVDATGSMGDEIAKLKASMRAMAQQIAQLPGQPDICWGLVAYRDRGDAFVTRTHDFTDDLGAFQDVLARVQAGGGGDTPEALNEALHEVVHGLAWRRDAARLVVLVADAPPHLDYGGPQYDADMQAALAKGIKVFAVGASGLDPVGEYVFRQIAQYTAGRFVFLTYREAADPGSGPGGETVHDVRHYSVQTLDRLVVRLVGEELGRLTRG